MIALMIIEGVIGRRSRGRLRPGDSQGRHALSLTSPNSCVGQKARILQGRATTRREDADDQDSRVCGH